MKKIIFSISISILSFSTQAQNYFPASGNCGINGFSAAALPNSNLQVHGTQNYLTVGCGGLCGHGITARIGMTNTTTGSGIYDGAELRMSEKIFVINNQESDGALNISVGSAKLYLDGANNRIWAGSAGGQAINNQYSAFNFYSPNTTNAMSIKATGASAHGLSIQTNTTANAIQVFGATLTRSFKVTGAGEVFARKYTTTLNSIPDYVFEPNYKLMPLNELKDYVLKNKHLPNIPSAKEYAEKDVDLGELNRLLLEKVEELTLYILQQEERLKELENKK